MTEDDSAIMAMENVHICITCGNLQRNGYTFFCAKGEELTDLANTCTKWEKFAPEAS